MRISDWSSDVCSSDLIASVEIGSDITTAYALVNGARSVYIPVTKRADASTWEVVKRVKAALPDMQAAVPDDIKVSYEFDQSGYVINSLKGVLFEGMLGALLTGLMRSEEHTSELQSLMRISYAVFCLK